MGRGWSKKKKHCHNIYKLASPAKRTDNNEILGERLNFLSKTTTTKTTTTHTHTHKTKQNYKKTKNKQTKNKTKTHTLKDG